MKQNPLFLQFHFFIKPILLSLAVLVLLPACQKGDLSGLNEETVVSSLSLVSIDISANDPAYPNLETTPPYIMPLAEQQQFDVTGLTDTGETVLPGVLNSEVKWSVSGTNLAVIDANGLLTANAAGTVTVTATLGTLPAVSTDIILFADLAQSVLIDDVDDTTTTPISEIILCKPVQLQAVAKYDDNAGTTFDWDITDKATWASDSSKTLSATPGLVAYTLDRPSVQTFTTITAVATNFPPGSTDLNVLYETANFYFNTIILDATPATLNIGATLQLIANAERGSTATAVTLDDISNIVDWMSADPNVLTVNENGLVSAVAAGSTTISATCGSAVVPTDPIETVQSTIRRVEIVKSGTNLESGAFDIYLNSVDGDTSRQLFAKAYYADNITGVDIKSTTSPAPVWSVRSLITGNSSASVDNNGLVTATTDTGLVEVSVQFEGLEDDVVVKVNPYP